MSTACLKTPFKILFSRETEGQNGVEEISPEGRKGGNLDWTSLDAPNFFCYYNLEWVGFLLKAFLRGWKGKTLGLVYCLKSSLTTCCPRSWESS